LPVPNHRADCRTLLYPIRCRDCGRSVFMFSCTCGCRVLLDVDEPPWQRHTDTCPGTELQQLLRELGLGPAIAGKLTDEHKEPERMNPAEAIIAMLRRRGIRVPSGAVARSACHADGEPVTEREGTPDLKRVAGQANEQADESEPRASRARTAHVLCDKRGRAVRVAVYADNGCVTVPSGAVTGCRRMGSRVLWEVLADGDTQPRRFVSPPALVKRLPTG